MFRDSSTFTLTSSSSLDTLSLTDLRRGTVINVLVKKKRKRRQDSEESAEERKKKEKMKSSGRWRRGRGHEVVSWRGEEERERP